MSDLARNPFTEAKEKGLTAVVPGDHDLFLDIDDRADFKVMDATIAVLRHNNFGITEYKKTRSKSGNWHVYLKTELPLDPLMRIALQACLGSDRTREVLSVLRHIVGNYHPTVFFEKES
jgi:hypothetical protein